MPRAPLHGYTCGDATEVLNYAGQYRPQVCVGWQLNSRAFGMVARTKHILMSAEEIIRRLRMLRYSPDNRASVRGGRKIPLKYAAWLANLHRATLYRAIMSGQISDKTREALSPVLIMLTERAA